MIWVVENEFEVIDDTIILVIDLDKATCQFDGWQISEIPCKHAMECIM